jgi:hypothetical protein
MLKFADRAGGGRSGSHAWNQICFSDSSFHTWNPICFSDREIRGGGRCPAAGRIGDVLAASTQGGAEPRARKRGIGWRSSAREAGAPRGKERTAVPWRRAPGCGASNPRDRNDGGESPGCRSGGGRGLGCAAHRSTAVP